MKIERSNFLIWMKDNTPCRLPSVTIPHFSTGNGDGVFCVAAKKSKDYHSLFISKKAKLPNAILNFKMISMLQKSNYNKFFRFHIKSPLNLM